MDRNPLLDRLEPLVGTWRTEITMLDDEGRAGARYQATDCYEWMPGRFFMLHHIDAKMPDGAVKALEVAGLKDDASGFFVRSYDNHGGQEVYDATMEGARWSLVSDSARFDGEFDSSGGTHAGRWHRREAEQWLPWMDVVLTRHPDSR